MPDAINKGYFKEKRAIENGFVPINNRKFLEVVNWRHAKKIKDFLLENDFIECNGTYSKSEHIRLGYRIHERWAYNPIERHKVPEELADKMSSGPGDEMDQAIINNLSELNSPFILDESLFIG